MQIEALLFQLGAAVFAITGVLAAVRLGAIRWSWSFPDWLTYRPLK